MPKRTLNPSLLHPIPIRLGAHGDPRRLAIRATVEKADPGDDKITVWGEAPIPERVETFLGALREGVPKLLSRADPSIAKVITTSKRDQGGVDQYDIEVLVPPIQCSELAPLAGILRTSFLAGTTAATIEELGVSTTRECPEPEPAGREVPFKWSRAKGRDRIGDASLTLEFKSDLDDGDGKELERWVTSWFRLVEAGAFFVRSTKSPSYGELVEIVDPYPDIWTFHCEQLVVDDATCAPLLERLTDVHAKHPIKKARLG